MTFNSAFITKKLEIMTRYVGELEELLKYPDSRFFTGTETMHVAERLIQLIVDGMIDINQHFIRELNLNISDDLKSTFIILGEKTILPLEFAKRVSGVVGVRNILVHQYEELDKELFLKNVRKNIRDFGTYQKHILEYSKKKR